MAQQTAVPGTPTTEDAPPDIATMRAAVDRLLDPDAVPETLPPAAGEVAALTLQMRGHIALLAPEVEAAGRRLPAGSMRAAVLGCVWEASSRLQAEPCSRNGGPLTHARRLARVLNALCEHYERLGIGEPPEEAALRRLGEHSTMCPTCRTSDDDGANAGLSCTEGDRLYEAYRQARRTPRPGSLPDETARPI